MSARQLFWDEDGAAGIWSLFIFVTCTIVAGLAVDGTNAMRAREHLQATADIASHAGLIELIRGGSDDEIRSAVAASVETNMPQTVFGNTIGTASNTITIGHYQNGSIGPSNSAADNAVAVTLQQNTTLGNAVPTFLLKLIGLSSWNIATTSAAVMDEAGECASNDGIFAFGEIKMTSTSEIGAGFCIYSKDVVEMSNHNNFLPGSNIGMPDTANCSHCTDSHNPGVQAALFEANMQLEDVETHVDTVVYSLLGTGYDTSPTDDFLANVGALSDLSALAALDYNTAKIKKGSIISISGGDFESMPTVPSGLIYAVYCSSPLSTYGAISPSPSSGNGNGKNSGSSNANVKTLDFETTAGTSITDVAIVTDCKIKFGDAAYIQNSIIATTSTSNQSISASSKARIGSGEMTCPSTEKVVVMTKGDLSVPAAMETNNVDFYIVGDAHLASGTSSQATKLGTSFYVGGDIHISAQGNWYACGDDTDSLAAEIGVIRHVITN
ncbi:Tad domain-containing protein [Tropicimonas sediminicola]|uniref:Flp pilus assembly protein TadG n=1 Tax=Tropicimonas sediminicola TaxID=1031541 RepID=A0A239CJA1_9RHOB|nr:Tad domain-containing protein [Tropicimonas sediminicola]SNS20247.1 Flp pilus assembly protein TadG [Tropicimonas sediminicola]